MCLIEDLTIKMIFFPPPVVVVVEMIKQVAPMRLLSQLQKSVKNKNGGNCAWSQLCVPCDAANSKASHPEKRRRGTNEAKLPF